MKVRFLAIAIVVGIFSGISHADSCAAGPFSNLLGTSCTIGDKTFTFSDTTGASDPSILNSLSFTPTTTTSSSGFNITGLPTATGSVGASVTNDFYEFFTAVPSSGTITSTTATLVGLALDNSSGNQTSFAVLSPGPANGSAEDEYDNNGDHINHTVLVGGPFSTFDGYFEILNASNGGGAAGFQSADFVFNESTTTAVPEGPELPMLAITAVGLLVALRRKFRAWEHGGVVIRS